MGLVLTPEQYHIVETWSPGAGKILKEWRESRKWSQKKVAQKCLCEDSLITQWEREAKRPTGQRKELLLSIVAPANIVKVTTDGYVTGADLEALLNQIQVQHEAPIEQLYYLMEPNVPKVLICIVMKSTGTVMPGVDISACKLFKDWWYDIRAEFELSQGKKAERLSTRGKKWIESSLIGQPDATTIASNPSDSIVDESTPTAE